MSGARIDASGDAGGGTVLVGGSKQGKGEVRNALTTDVDSNSTIFADALREGDGGTVIVWADNTTFFDGKIYSRGGSEGGNGGFVETSGKERLGGRGWLGEITGFANASAPLGKFGDWLLDPQTIAVSATGAGTLAQAATCASGGAVSLSVATLQAATANVVLCAQTNAGGSITISSPFTLPTGISLTLTAGSTNVGPIALNAGITTRGQPITLTGVVTLGAAVVLDTTNAGANPTGGNISFSSTINGAIALVLTAGTGGTVTMSGAVGATTALTSLTATGATITQSSTAKTTGALSYTGPTAINVNGNITTSGGVISLTGPVTIAGSPTIDTTNAGGTAAGANISFTSTLNGANALTLRAGTAGAVSFAGAVGGTSALTNLVFTSANTIQIGNNITVSGANPLSFPDPVSLTGASTITSNNANITFGSTLNGAQALITAGGTGTTTFTGAVGGTTPLSSLSATAATVTQTSTAKTTGALSYTGSTAINVDGNVTTSGGIVTLTGPVTIAGTPTIDTTNAGGTVAGANISFSSTLNGATALTLNGGTGGTVSFGGAVGGTSAPTNLVFTNAALIQIANNITVSGANPLSFPDPVSLTGTSNITSNNAGITFGSTLNGAQALTLTAGTGTVAFNGIVGGTTPLTNFTFASAGLIQVGNNITVSGANSLSFPDPVSLTGTSTITSNNANITFGSTLNGAQALTLAGGTGTTTFTGAVGGTTALSSLSATAATITQTSTAKTTGALSYTGSTAINVDGNVTTSGGVVTLTGPVTIAGSPTIDTTNAGGTAAGANISFTTTLNGANALTLRAGTAGVVSFAGAVGGTTPLTNLVFTSANTIQIGNNITMSGANPLSFPDPVSLTGTSNITSNNANISFGSTLNGAQALTLTGGTGTVAFNGIVGGTVPLTNLSFASVGLIQIGNNITVSGANPLVFPDPVSLIGTGNITSNNANITFGSTLNGAQALTLTAGTGTVAFNGIVGGTTPLTNLTFASAGLIQVGNNITVSGANPLSFPDPVSLTGTSNITSNNANITFGSTLNGAQALTLTAGTGTVAFNGAVGGTTPLTNLSFASAALIQVGNNITVSGTNPLVFADPVSLTGTSNIASNNANISFGSTLNGAQALTLTGGTGTTTFTGAIGGTTPLTTLSVTAATITQSSTAKTTGALSYTGSTAINVNGNVTTSGGLIALTGPATITGNPTFDTTNAGGTPTGANISFSSTLNGATALTLNGGTVGNISFAGAVGGTAPLTNLVFAGGNLVQVGSNITVSGANPLVFAIPVSLTGTSNITSNNANITFGSTLNGAQSLTLAAGIGTVAFNSAVGNATPLTNLAFTSAGLIQVGSIITVSGANPLTFPSPVSLTGTSMITSNNANITFSSTLNGASSLTLAAGSGTVAFNGIVGGTAPLTNLGFISAGLIQIGNNITVSGANSLLFPDPVSLTGPSTITSNNANITFSNTLNGAQSLTLVGGTGAVLLGKVGGTTPLTNLVFTSASLIQISDNITVSGANPLSFPDPVSLTGSSTVTSNNANITFGSSLNGAQALTLTAGTGTVAFNGIVGGTAPLTNLSFASAGLIQIGNNITVSGANPLVFPDPVSLTGISNITSNNANITFGSTLNGAQALTLTAGTGTVAFNGVVGGTIPLTNLIFGSAALIQVGSNITVSGANPLAFPDPVSLTGTSTITSNNANITFGSTLNGAQALTLTAGTGTVAFNGIVGGITPLTNLTFASAALIQVGNNITVSGTNPLVFPNPVSLTGTSTITSNNANITFGSTLNGAQALTLVGGTGTTTFTGAIGGTTPLTTLSVTAATITQSSTAKTAGALSYTGSTAINVDGNITTSGGIVTLTGPVTIAGNPTFDTTNAGGTPAGANISFSSTLNGATALTLRAGTAGVVFFAGAVGGTTPLTNLVFTSANAIQIGSNITVSGANPLVFPDPVSLTGTSNITSNNANITFGSTLNGAQALTLTAGTGTVAFNGIVGGTAPLTNLTFASAALIQIGNNITVSGANPLVFSSPVSLTGTSNITSNNANITFGSTLNGAQALTLTAGTGTVAFNGIVGGTTPLTNLTFASAALIQIGNNITVSGANPLVFPDPVSLTGTSNITSNNANITFGSTLNGAQALTLTAGTGTVAFNGIVGGTAPLTNLTFASAALIQVGNNITVSGANPLVFPDPVSLTGTSNITSNNANITFGSTLNGAQALTLTAGTGTVAFNGIVGGTAPLTNLTFASAALIQIGNNITVSGANPLVFSSPVSLTGTSNITSNNANITFGSTLNGAQALTLTAGTGTVAFNGIVGGTTPLTNLSFASAALIQVGNNITVSGANPLVFPDPVSLTGTSTITSNNANITFGSTLNGAQVLTLLGGTGTTTFTGAIGGTTPLSSLNATAATVTQSSTAKTTGALSYTGSTVINVDGSMTTSGGLIALTGPATIAGNPTFDTTNAGGTPTGANISFSSTLNGATALTLNGGSGGTISFAGAVGGITPLTNLSFTNAALIRIGSNITVSGANPLMFPDPVSLTGTSNIISNNANITFGSTLNGAQALTLTAGTGTVAFNGIVGGTTPLTNLTFASAGLIQVGNNITVSGANPLVFPDPVSLTGTSNITSNNANITFGSTLNGAQALTLTAGTGTVAFNGIVGGTTPLTNLSFASAGLIQVGNNITVSGANPLSFPDPVSLTGTSNITSNNANITFGSTLNGAHALTLTGGTGTVAFNGAVGGTTPLSSLSATAATINQNSTANTTGALSYTGSTAINVNGNITTSGGIITMTGPVAIANNPTFDTTNGGGTPTGANISFSSTLNGATALTLNGGTGGIVSFAGAVGGITPLTNLSFTNAAQIQIGNNITVSGANPLVFPSPVLLTGNSVIQGNNANITFGSTLDGAEALTLSSCGGNITFVGAVGGITPLTSLTITCANNVTANAISAGSITQQAGTGTTTFNGPLSTTGPAGISLTGTNFAINGNVTTTNGGPLFIDHSGTLTYGPGVILSISGPYTDTGTGSTGLQGNFLTNGNNITFGSPVTLIGATSINTCPGVGNILFSNTVDGAQNLTLNACGGNITFVGAVGGITRLGTLTVTDTNNFTANALTLAAFDQIAGTGTSTFNGPVNLSTSAGLSITTTNIDFNNTLTTANTGPATMSVTGTLVLTPAAVFTLAGPFSESGGGAVQSAGSITTADQNIQFADPVAFTGTSALNSGGANILFSNTVDGPGALGLTAGAGNITFSAAVGSLTRLGALTLNSATNLSALSINAASINQIGVTGNSTYAAINTNGAAGVQLTGNTFTINGNLTTTGGGPFTITNSGLLNLTAGSATSLSSTFTQNGTGAVDFAGTLITNNAALSFTSPITLTGAASLSTGSGAGNITLSSTVDGAQTLSLTSGTGNLVLGGNVGSTTRLSDITINQAGNVSTLGITAASLTQLVGIGTSTFNGVVNTNTVTGINLTGTNFTFNNNVTTTAAGPLFVNNSGLLTFASGTTDTIGGAFSQVGTGGLSLASQITAGGAITTAGAITVSGNASLSTAAASQNITLNGTVDGSNNLTLAAGGGNIVIASDVGDSTRLGTLTFSSADNVTTQGLTAASIVQSAGTGTTTFTGVLNTNAIGGINLTLNNFSRNGAIITTNGGPFIVTNTGTVTLVSPSNTLISGSFQQNGGAGSVNLSGTIATSNQPITFTSPITLTGATTLNSGTGTGNITLSTVTGANALTLAAGNGNIVTGAIGATPLTTVTFSSANNITTAAISAGSIIQSAGSGTSIFNGALSTTTGAGISLTGTNFQFPSSITTTGTGSFALANTGTASFGPGSTLSINGSFAQNGAGAVSLGSNITTTIGAISFAAPITLIGATNLNSVAANGNIIFSSTIDGAQALSLSAGGGNINVNGTIGAITPLSSFTTVSDNDVTLENIGTVGSAGISGLTSLTSTTNINLMGTTYNLDTESLTAPTVSFNGGSLTTIITNGNPIAFNATSIQLGIGTDLTINSTGGNITLAPLHALANNGRNVTLNAGSGTIEVFQIGTLNNGEFSSVSLNGGNLDMDGDIFSNSLTLGSTGQISLGGNITTVNTPITFPAAVVLDTIPTVTVSTGSTGANITFSSTIDGDVALTRSLVLAAGSGNIALTGAVGGTAPLAALTFASANNVTANNITVGALTQLSGIGTTTFNGLLATSNALGINLTGNAFTFNNTVTTTSGGALQIANSGLLSMPTAATLNLSGPFSQTGSGPVQIGDSITSDGALFTSPVSLIGNASVSTTAAAQPITFMSTIDNASVGGPFNLSLDSGTSDISILGNVGSNFPIGTFFINQADNVTVQAITSNAITVNGGSGTTTVNGNLLVGSGGIDVTGTNFVLNGNVTTTNGGSITLNNSGSATGAAGIIITSAGNYSVIGTGPVFATGSTTAHGNILITGPITLVGNTSLNSTLAGASITLSNTIDGLFNLGLTSSGGPVLFSGNIGSLAPISNLSISGASDLTTQGIQAASITETAGTGTTTFNGALATSGASGISINANSIVRGAAITTTGNGPLSLSISNTGTLASTAAGAISVSGPFTQSGTGAVALGGSITTAKNNLSFAGPITLSADTSLNTGLSGTGSITLSESVQGGFALTLASGNGNINIGGDVGTVTPLTNFAITNAANVTTNAISAGSITQNAGTGTATFNGALSTTGAAGISLNGNAIVFNSPFTTTGTGPVTITNTGLLTFGVGATGSVAGALVQNGTGSTSISSAITSVGAMQFNGPFSVTGSGSLATSNQPITFFSTLDGPGNLTLASGTGNILVTGAAGSITPLGNLIVSSVGSLTTQGIAAASFAQTAGTGTTLIQGNLSTSGVGGVNLTGSAFTFLQNVTTTGVGPLSINNSGTLTTTAGKTFSSNGIFTQNGSGSVLLAGSVVTTNLTAANANINFTGTSPITLTAPTSIDSSLGGGTINFSAASTISGPQPITLTAGTGDINILGNVGSLATPLGAFTIVSANNIEVQAITANSITQTAGTGTSTLLGSLTSNTPVGINLAGNMFALGPLATNITTTNGGSFTLTNSGLAEGSVPITASIDGSFIQNGAGTTAIGGSITTNHGGISFTGPVIVGFSSTLDSSASSGNIVFSNAVNGFTGTENFTLTAGGGNVTFSQPIGSVTPLDAITINSAHNLTTSSVAAASISGSGLTGATIFNGPLSTTTAAGISLNGNVITFNSNVTTTGTGPLAITNSGLLTVANGSLFNLDGAFTQTGGGAAWLGGSISTNSAPISFAAPIIFTSTSNSFNTGSGANITFNGSLDGATALSLAAGTGNVDFQGTIGLSTPLTSLTIASAADVLVDLNAIVSGAFMITSATGPTTFNGTLNAGSLNLTGSAFNFNNAVTTTAGPIAITNSGALTIGTMSPFISNTSFTQTGAGTISLGSNISTTGTLSMASPITLTSDLTLNSGGDDLTLSNTVDGGFDLTLTAGLGDITLSGDIGDTTRLAAFIITSANDIDVQAITAGMIDQQASTGTATLQGDLNTNTIAGITLVGTNFISSGTVTTTNGGPFILTNSGFATGTGASVINLDGAFTQNGTGPVNVGGTTTTNNANISFTSPVSVLLPGNFTSNGGNIVFSNSVDGPACLTLTAGSGDVQLNGIVGGTTPLGCLTASGDIVTQNSSVQTTGAVQETGTTIIQVGGNIVTNANPITLTGNVSVTAPSSTLSTSGGAGDILITGTVNGNAAGHDLAIQTGTGDITIDGAIGGNTPFHNLTMSANNITWPNLGSGVIGATGVTSLTATTDINFTGTSYNNGTQNYTAANFNFNAGTPTTINSNALPITFNTGTIQLSNDLTLNSNGGNITLSPLLGTGFNFTGNADVGNFNFVQIGASGQDLNNVNLTANAFSPTPVNGTNVFATSLTVNSPSVLTISTNQTTGAVTYNSPVVFQGNINYTCGTAGTITFNQRVDANTAGVDSVSFDFNPCTGSLVFNGPIGAIAPLAFMNVNAPTDVQVNSVMNVGSFDVTNGTGTTTIGSGITSTALGGISIETPVINLAGAITTASSGPLVLDNAGALTVAAGASFNLSGALQQTGTGSVSIGGSVITHDSTIAFSGPITLSGATTFNSDVLTGADISFGSTIQGAQNLTINSGGSDITFSGAVGTVGTPIDALQITSARNVTASFPIYATTITQMTGSGTSTFDMLNTNALNGIQLTGNAFTFNNTITTTGNGIFVLNNTGLATFNAGATGSIASSFTQNGTGSTILSSSITTGGAVRFSGPFAVSGTGSITATNQPITFFNTVDGPGNLTLASGTADISLQGSAGSVNPLGSFTISSARNVTSLGIAASSLTQTAGTGTTTITGNIATTGVAGISLTGTNFTLNGTVTTTNAGPFSIVNTGPLSLTLGNSTLIAGPFAQSGGGQVSLSGTVATNDQTLSFANAVTLSGATALTSGGADITLSSTVDGNQSLNLAAGAGNIILGGTLGGTTPLGALTVNSVNNITYPQVSASSISQLASSGTTTITGPLSTSAVSGVSIAGTTITQNGTITTINGGPVSFINSGLFTMNNNTTAAGAYSQSGGGAVSIGGSTIATDHSISIAGATTLNTDTFLNSGPVGGDITFFSTIDGGFMLNFTAVSGTINLLGNVGSITPLTSFVVTSANNVSTLGIVAGSIIQNVGTGTTTFNGALSATGASGITLNGAAFTFNSPFSTSSGPFTLTNTGLATFNAGATGTLSGTFTQNGMGSVQLSSSISAGGAMQFVGPVLASGSASLQTTNQPITFLNTVDGPGNLTLASGSANILFSLNGGFTTRLGALQITSANNFTAQGINAASFQQLAGSGLTLFNGDLNTNGASGINIAGTGLTFLGNVTTTGTGPITLTNSGVLMTTAGKTISSNGVFTQNGSGNVVLAGTELTTSASAPNADINFTGSSPITLTAPALIDSV